MGQNEKIKKSMDRAIKKNPYDLSIYIDMFDLCREHTEEDFKMAHAWNHAMRTNVGKIIQKAVRERDFDTAEKADNLLFRSLLLGAPHYFDDYMQAIEYGKPHEKKFYNPRRHYLKRYVDEYQKVLDGELDFLSISMPKRCGKALTLDTLIPTPTGFKTMGEIRKGDWVLGADGYETEVQEVFPQGKVPVFEVKFNDGFTVKTCANHLWEVRYNNRNRRKGHETKILTTKEIMDSGVKSKDNHNLYSIKHCEPVEFGYKKVELDPYIMGLLLGDGCFHDNVTFTNPEEEIIDSIRKYLPEEDEIIRYDYKQYGYCIKSKVRKHDEHGYPVKCKTAAILDKYGLIGKRSWEKYIPDDYIFNSSVVRYELLCGLLDTDGYAAKSSIEFSTTSPYLKEQVCMIVRSLGGTATVGERMGRYTKDGKSVSTRTNYRINIYFKSGMIPFKLKRKAKACQPKREVLYHYIESITPCGEEEAQCICVDAEDHLFLCGDYFVPTHNSQMGLNFVNMLSGRRPDRATLMEGTGDALVNSFYKGCLEYMQLPNEYHYYDIFPDCKLVQTNADDKTINLNEKSRFPTIMCRSIDSRQVGLSEATNLLYLDDCVEGREEAKDRTRLDKKWEILSGDIIGRAIEGTPIVICGTRYSLYDPIGHLQEEMRKQGKRMCILETPALDLETDESNFEYIREGKKVFTTKYFRDQRDMLSAEQFESEFQQTPFEAKGLMFPKDKLNYFFELPIDREPDARICVCDTADTGEDSLSMPIGYLYGPDIYIPDVVFDDSPAYVTKPECAKAIMDHMVSFGTFESNNAGEYFARDVNELLKGMGYTCSIITKRTISNKQTRIEFASDNIIKHFYFKHPSTYERNSQYDLFMRQVTTHTRSGKVKHDDAPDSLSLMENEMRKLQLSTVEVMKRPC